MMQKTLLLVIFCFAVAAPLFAQDPENGSNNVVTFDQGFMGAVDLNRGSLSLNAKLLELKQKPGLDFGSLYFAYAAPTYQLNEYCGYYESPDYEECFDVWEQTGGGMGIGVRTAPVWWTETTQDDNGVWNNSFIVVASMDGSTHPLIASGNSYRSLDGSGYRVSSDGRTLTDAEGTTYVMQGPAFELVGYKSEVFLYGSSASSDIVATNIRGQSLTFTPSSSVGTPNGAVSQTTVRDSIGRLIEVGIPTSDFNGCAGPLPTVAAFIARVSYGNQVSTQFKYCFATIHVVQGFSQGDTYSRDQDVFQSLARSSDGSWVNPATWTFEYGWGTTSANSANLTRVVNPAGGSTEYAYGSSLANSAINYYQSSAFYEVSSKRVRFGGTLPDSFTTYNYTRSITWPYPVFQSATVTSDTDIVEHTFEPTSGVENQTTYRDTAGNLTKTVSRELLITNHPYHRYSRSGAFPLSANAQISAETISYPDGTSCRTERQYGGAFSYNIQFEQSYYSGLEHQSGSGNSGQVTQETTYDCSAGPAPVLRTVVTDWLNLTSSVYDQANLHNLPSKIDVYGANGLESRKLLSYDEQSSVPRGELTSTNDVLWTANQNQSSSVISTRSYNSDGMLHIATDPRGHSTTIDYDATGVFEAVVTHPATGSVQHYDSYTWDPVSGVQLSHTNENNILNTLVVDQLRRPILAKRAVGTPKEAWTRYSYPSFTKTVVAGDKDATQDGVIRMTLSSDLWGRTVSTINSSSQRTDFTLDASNHVLSQSNPYLDGTSPPAASTVTYQYDALGRMTKKTNQDGTFQTWTFSGNSVTVTDETRTNSWTQVANSLGDVVKVTEPNTAVTTYAYDSRGNLKAIHQSGLQGETPRDRTATYDSLSRLVTSTNPESGTICFGTWTNSNCGNGYDGNNNLQYKTDARGLTVSYSYDELNRLVGKSYVSPSASQPSSFAYSYFYDEIGHGNAKGHLTRASNNVNGAEDFTYDFAGNLVAEKYCLPSDCTYNLKATAAYDLAGNLISLLYPSSRQIQISADLSGRTNSITNLSWASQLLNQPLFVATNGYDSQNHLTSATIGNNIVFSAGFDARSRPATRTYGIPNATLWSRQYNWTAVSNLASATDTQNGVQRRFGYDPLNRILSAEDFQNGSVSPGGMNESYSYDSFGNLQINSVSGATNSHNQNLSLPYDAAGNQTSDGAIGLSWDGEGRLSSAGSTAYSYDALGDRVGRTGSMPEELVYFGGRGIARKVGGNWTDFIFGPEGLLAELPGGASSTPQYVITDYIGNTVGNVGSVGTLASKIDQTPYGTVFSGTTNEAYRFAGKETDPDTSKIDFGARSYTAAFGRWLSPDWSDTPSFVPYSNIINPQTLNLYAYSENNPLGAADLDGHSDTNCSGQGDLDSVCLAATTDLESVEGRRKLPGQPSNCTPNCQAEQRRSNNQSGDSQAGPGGSVPKPDQKQPAKVTETFTREQCRSIRLLLAREKKYGTTIAARMSSNTWGDGSSMQSFNSEVIPNPMTALGRVDLDWFTDVRSFSNLANAIAPAVGPVTMYENGKIFWTAARLATSRPIGNWAPFQDPGERSAVAFATISLGYKDLFPPSFVNKVCPK